MCKRLSISSVSTFLLMVFLIMGTVGCRSNQAGSSAQAAGGRVQSYTGQLEPDDGQWVRATKDFANTRYSSLDQITTANVAQLRTAWTFSTGVTQGQEAAPIVANNTMSIATPWPNVLYALDLTQPGAPIKWKYEPHPSPAAKGEACCDWVTRGAVFDNGKIYFNTLDGYTIALNADTGAEQWKAHLADITKGETITMAPMVVNNHVLVGNSGGLTLFATTVSQNPDPYVQAVSPQCRAPVGSSQRSHRSV
jgi:glucose dehydrogenase